MKLLVISSNTPATGNEVTMQRICSFFTDPTIYSSSSSTPLQNTVDDDLSVFPSCPPSSHTLSNQNIETYVSSDSVSLPSSQGTHNDTLSVSTEADVRLPWSVQRLDCNKTNVNEIQSILDTGNIDILIVVHAYRSGQFLSSLRLQPMDDTQITNSNKGNKDKEKRIPVILLLSGTDVNELFVKLGEKYHHHQKSLPTNIIPSPTSTTTISESSIDPVYNDSSVRSLYTKTQIAMKACYLADRLIALTPEMEEGFKYACQYMPLDKLLHDDLSPSSSSSSSVVTTNLLQKLHIIRQGIIPPSPLPLSNDSSLSPYLRTELNIPENSFICCLVCGLREVKDPFYLYPAFIRWIQQHQERKQQKLLPPIYLVTIGPALVSSLTQTMYDYTHATCIQTSQLFCEEVFLPSSSSSSSTHYPSEINNSLLTITTTPISSSTGVKIPNSYYGGKDNLFYHPPVSRDHLLQYIQQCNVFLNSSISEGESNAILEAMYCKVPVVARKNKGNQSIIEHNRSGYLYSTPDEGIEICRYLYNEYCRSKSPSVVDTTNLVKNFETIITDTSSSSSSSVVNCTPSSEIIRTAFDYIQHEHSNEHEREKWIRLVKDVYLER